MAEEQNQKVVNHEVEGELRQDYIKTIKNGSEILIVDPGLGDKDYTDILAFNIAQILWGGEYTNVDENQNAIDPVDIIGDLFPKYKIYLVTNVNHFQNHYVYKIESYWLNKQEALQEFINNRPEPRDTYAIAFDREKAYGMGVHGHTLTLADEYTDDIIKEIIKTVFKAKGYNVDKVLEEEDKRTYLYFIPQEFIYQHKIIQSYIVKRYVIPSEFEKQYAKKVDWYSFYEIDENFVDYILDP